MKIEITKRDAVYSYVNYVLTALSNVIVLPFVLNKVSTEEYALWSVFLSIQTLVMLIDTGFSTLTVRYTTYAYCGAKSIPLTGTPDMGENLTNYPLLFQVFFVAKNIYRKITGLAFVALCFGGSIYIAYLSHDLENSHIILFSWLIFSMGVILKIYFTYYSSFLKGMGHIQEVNIISITNTLVYITIKLILVLHGWGILGIAVGNIGAVLATRIMVIKCVKNIIGENPAAYLAEKHAGKNHSLYKAFRHNAKQLGSVVISNYIQGQGTTLVCASLMPLQYTASYGLTVQLVNMLVSFANIPFNTFKPQLNELRISKQKEKFKDMYSFITFSIWGIYSIGSIGMILILPPILSLIHSQTLLLPTTYMLLICLYQFICINHQRATDIIALGNQQPYAKAYVISSIVMLMMQFLAFRIGGGLIGFIVASLLAQLAYNGWKWPREVFKLVNISALEVCLRGVKQLRHIIFGGKNVAKNK